MPFRFALAPLLAILATAASAAPVYRIHDLGVGPGGYSSQVVAINDRNELAGWIQTTRLGPHKAVIFKPDGSIVKLGTLEGDDSSFATGINNLGQVVGYSGSFSTPHAFVYDPAVGIRSIGALDPARGIGTAEGISDDGTVVGQSETADGVSHAFVWKRGTGMVDAFPNRGASDAAAINAKGQWTGHVDGPDRTVGVRVTIGGGAVSLGNIDPNSPYTYGKGLNNTGGVIGYGSSDGASHAIVWSKAQGIRDIGLLPGGTYSNGLGINDAGQGVGIADVPGGRSTVNVAFYYDAETGMVDASTLVDPADPLFGQVQFDAGQAINNHGVIATNGMINGEYHAFALVPMR